MNKIWRQVYLSETFDDFRTDIIDAVGKRGNVEKGATIGSNLFNLLWIGLLAARRKSMDFFKFVLQLDAKHYIDITMMCMYLSIR